MSKGGSIRLFAACSAVMALTTACAVGGTPDLPLSAPDTPMISTHGVPDQSTTWPRAEAADVGLDPTELRRAVKAAKRSNSSCLAVVRDDKLVGDWNWGPKANAPREVFSVTKSVTAALIGIAESDGSLALEDRVSRWVPKWRGTRSEGVTIRQIMNNSSGRFWTSESDYSTLVQAEDRTDYAIGLRQQFRPGTSWAYNNSAIQVLDRVLSEATGVETWEFAEERLFKPLGMHDSRLTRDISGTSTNVFFGMQTTCLDLARFGLLFLHGGEVDGQRLLPSEFVQDAVGHSSTKLNAAYGLLWWLNRTGPFYGPLNSIDANGRRIASTDGQMAPGADEAMYAARGLGGQVVLVDPATDTVVVRLGAWGNGTDYDFADAAALVTASTR